MADHQLKEDLLKEYEILRGEISENSRLIAHIFAANTSVTSAIFGIGLAADEPYGPVFLTPLAILIPSLFFIASQLESTTIISQYLRIILEPQLKIQWQTNWYELRKWDLLPTKRKYIPAVSGLYGILSLTCFIMAGIYWDWAPPYFSQGYFAFWTLLSAIPLIIAIKTIHRAFSMDFREAVARGWQELRDSHQANMKNAHNENLSFQQESEKTG
ncbi:MAG: hypothetical protein ACXW00_04485 [Methylobacter sp.]